MTSGGSAAAAAAAASVTSTASSSSSNQNSSSSASSDQQQASSMATSSTTSSSSSSSSAAAAPTTTVDIPPQLAQLSEGWLELESDPGLFSLLISDFGVRGVQVEEIYDLERPFPEQQPVVYGFIFLFNVIEERRNRSRRRDAADNLLSSGGLGGGGNGGGGLGSGGYGYGFGDTPLENPSPSSLLTGEYLLEDDGNEANQELLKQIFFAYQKVPNSCATHAILSVLLNCSQVDLGPMLRRLKDYTRDMSAESKGYAISNIPELAVAHNSHAAPLSAHREQQAKGAATNAVRISQRHSSSCEAFHYVSFLPIGGRLIELDGLKEAPIDHGPVDEEGENGGEPWTEKFRRLMRKRIEITVSGGQGSHSHHHSTEHDIRYNLMAVIPSRYERAAANLRAMSANRLALLKMIQILEFSSPAGGHVRRDHSYAREGLLPSGPTNNYPGPQAQTHPQPQNSSESPKDGGLKRKSSGGEISEASSPKRKNVSGGGGGGGSLNIGLEWPDPLKLARSPGTIRMTLDDESLLSAKEEEGEEGLGGSSSSRGNFTFGYDFPKGDGPFGGSQSDVEHSLKDEEEEDTEEEKLTESPSLPSATSFSENTMPHKSTDDVKKEEKNEEEKEEDDDDRTETASNASSSYNDLFEAEDGEEQVASNSKGGSEPTVFESRFFVCKFEHRPKSTASEEKDGKQKAELEVPTENKENETKKIKVEVDGEQTPTIVKIENDEASKATIKPSSKSTTSNFSPPSSTSSSTITPTIITTPSEESSATTISTTNKQIYSVLERIRALQSSSSSPSPSSPSVADFESHLKAPILKDLLTLLNGLNRQIGAARRRHAEEEAKQRRYRLDDSRRVHDYDPFITSFLAMFFEAGLMESVLEAELYQGGSSTAAASAAAAEAAAVEAAVAAAAAAASLGAATSSGEPVATSEKAAAATSTSKGERSSARAAALEKQQQQTSAAAVNGTAGNAAGAGKKDTTKDGLQIPNGTELGPLAPIVNTFSPAELTKASIALRRIYEQALFFPANFSVSAAMAAMKSAAAAAAATAANQNTVENKSSSANKSRRSRGKRGSNRLAVEEDDDDEMYEVYEEDEGDGEEEADDDEWNPAEENTTNHPKGSSSSSRSRQSK